MDEAFIVLPSIYICKYCINDGFVRVTTISVGFFFMIMFIVIISAFRVVLDFSEGWYITIQQYVAALCVIM